MRQASEFAAGHVPGARNAELGSLVIVPRGDFPAGSVDATRADGGLKRLPELPDDVAAITVEGRFGDIHGAAGADRQSGRRVYGLI